MGRLIKDNKTLVAVIGFAASLLIGWMVWTTTSAFESKSVQAVQDNCIQSIEESIGEMKIDLKDFKEDVNKKQDKMIDILMRMDKRRDDR